MPKSNFSRSPRKGTKGREILLLLVRPRGATVAEIEDKIGKLRSGGLQTYMRRFSDEMGWDIRSFPDPLTDHPGRGAKPVVYRVIGKMKWDCTYRSFVNN